jgi:hypothetical protein
MPDRRSLHIEMGSKIGGPVGRQVVRHGIGYGVEC